jgi:hypothetical protein
MVKIVPLFWNGNAKLRQNLKIIQNSLPPRLRFCAPPAVGVKNKTRNPFIGVLFSKKNDYLSSPEFQGLKCLLDRGQNEYFGSKERVLIRSRYL